MQKKTNVKPDKFKAPSEIFCKPQMKYLLPSVKLLFWIYRLQLCYFVSAQCKSSDNITVEHKIVNIGRTISRWPGASKCLLKMKRFKVIVIAVEGPLWFRLKWFSTFESIAKTFSLEIPGLQSTNDFGDLLGYIGQDSCIYFQTVSTLVTPH